MGLLASPVLIGGRLCEGDQRAGDGAAGHVALAAQGLDLVGAGALEDGVTAPPHRRAVVTGGAGERGDSLQAVPADRLTVAGTDTSFGGALLKTAGDDRTQQGGDDGEGGSGEGG